MELEDTHREDAEEAVRGSGTNLLAVVAGLSVMAYHALAARLYGAGPYGTYATGLGVTDVAARLSVFGTDVGLMRQIPVHRAAGERARELQALGTGLWLTLLGGGLLAALLALFSGPLARLQGTADTHAALRLLAPVTPFTGLVAVAIRATMAARVQRYNLLIAGLAQPLLLMACTIPLSFLLPGVRGLCLAHLLALAATATLALLAVRQVFGREGFRTALATRRPHGPLLRFSFPMALSDFLNTLLHRVDLILLGFYVSHEVVGTYAGAELLARAVTHARSALDPVAAPVFAEALERGDRARLRYNVHLMARWVALLTMPLVGFLVAFRADLLALFGPTFAGAAGPLVLLVLGHSANSLLGMSGNVVLMAGRSDLGLLNNVLAAGTNIGLCLVFIPRYGALGAAASAACAITLVQTLYAIELGLLQRTSLFSWALGRVLLAGSAAILAVTWLAPHLGPSPLLRLVLGTATLLVAYGLLLWLLGLGPEEQRIVRRFLGRDEPPPPTRHP